MSNFIFTRFKPLSSEHSLPSTTVPQSLRQGLGRGLLLASLTMLVSACDSANQEGSETAAEMTSPQAKSGTADTATANADIAMASNLDTSGGAAEGSVLNDPDLADDEGAGLLEFAEHRQSTPMIASRSGSSLGATLIGDYSGMLPCPSGQGDDDQEQVILNLYADGTARKTSHHQEPKRTSDTLSQMGSYQQLDNIITISFANAESEHYLINDNQLIFIEGDLPEPGEEALIQANPKYVLSRK